MLLMQSLKYESALSIIMPLGILENKVVIVLATIVVSIYIVYLIIRILRPKKSDYEKELDVILNSDQYKVKGKFEQ
jgi:hypothetical protein